MRKSVYLTVLATLLGATQSEAPAEQPHPLETSTLGTNRTLCDSVRNLPKGEDRCTFVKDNCPTESLIPYLKLFYCHARPAGLLAETALQVCCSLLLVLIFRVLGSTAEGFFSPILTQISQELGLPPRFAGVTLLALGNGAPDLVASIAFIKAGKFKVAVSGLFGGGMFVGAAVAGVVIMTAQGVKARGALLRDVSYYMLSVGVVAAILKSGRFTWALAIVLLVMYLVFVAVVLAADIHHIWRTRARKEPERKSAEHLPLLAGDAAHPPEAELPGPQPALESVASIELTEGQHGDSDGHEGLSWTQSGSGGRESTWSVDGRPLTYNEKVHMSGRTYRQMALAEMAHSNTFFGHQDMENARRLALLDEGDDIDDGSGAEAAGGYMPPQQQAEDQDVEKAPDGEGGLLPATTEDDVAGSEADSPDERQARVQQWCDRSHRQAHIGSRSSEPAEHSGQPSLPDRARPWRGGGSGRSTQGGAIFTRKAKSVWLRVVTMGNGLDVGLTVLEYPLLILRRVTIPLVDNDSYERQWFVAACVGAPVAVLWYSGKLTVTSTLPVALGIGVILAVLAYSFTVPEKPPEWSFTLPFPVGAAVVAAGGFVASAMWIDTIAGELVALLDYLGTLSGVPHEVLGLTVLAWGNSVGDLSTNTAMAKRGLSNMAMTACFAGPIFNLLMALSLGFMRFFATNGLSSTPVQMEAMDVPSIVLIFVNGALLMATGIGHKSWVPGWYGAVPLVLYVLYVAVSLAVAFG